MLDNDELRNFISFAGDPRQLSFTFEAPESIVPDIRAPAEIALAIVSEIFRDVANDWNAPARPAIRISGHREHVSPTGRERRFVAPMAPPAAEPPQAIRTQVQDLERDESGKIDLNEVRRAIRREPKDRYKTPRRLALAASVAAIMVGSFSAGDKKPEPQQMPEWARRVFEPYEQIQKALPVEEKPPGPRRRVNSPTGRDNQ